MIRGIEFIGGPLDGERRLIADSTRGFTTLVPVLLADVASDAEKIPSSYDKPPVGVYRRELRRGVDYFVWQGHE